MKCSKCGFKLTKVKTKGLMNLFKCSDCNHKEFIFGCFGEA